MDIKAISQLLAALGSGNVASLKPARDRKNFRPTGAALRDPNDPIQDKCIEAARFKRAERAVKAQRNYDRCTTGQA